MSPFYQVYFASRCNSPHMMKIGVTSVSLAERLENFPKRLRYFKPFRIHYAVPVKQRSDELLFHRYFAKDLAMGREWFRVGHRQIQEAIGLYLSGRLAQALDVDTKDLLRNGKRRSA